MLFQMRLWTPRSKSSLHSIWAKTDSSTYGRSGEIGLDAGFAQCMLPFVSLGAMRNKGGVQDLELVGGALHFPESVSFERFQST